MNGPDDKRAEIETAIAGLRYASGIVNREIINAAHHEEIRGLNRALDALRDEVENLNRKLGDLP